MEAINNQAVKQRVINMEYNTAILVLLYNKEIVESQTLSCLIKSNVYFKDCALTIWNNGPEKLKLDNVQDLENKGFSVNIIETIDNCSLSKIYNDFIDKNEADSYVILDDDSSLTDEYINDALNNKHNEISIPIISDENGNVLKPRVNKKIIKSPSEFKSSDKVKSVGSGLVIGINTVKTMKLKFGNVFDERFLFYAVDSTYFTRLKIIDEPIKIKVINGFKHSFSLREKNISDFRKKELSSSIGLKLRYYHRYGYVKIITKILSIPLKMLFTKRLKIYAGEMLISYLSGKHYKNRK